MPPEFSARAASKRDGGPGSWARPDRAQEYGADCFAPEADAAMIFARDTAFAFGQRYLAPVHLLFALCRDGTVSAGIFDRLGVSRASIWREAEERAPRGTPVPGWDMELSPGLERAIAHAHDELKATGAYPLTTRELLIGILREGEGLACEILREQGVTKEAIRQEDRGFLHAPAPAETSWPPPPGGVSGNGAPSATPPMALGYAKAAFVCLIIGFAASLVGTTGFFLLFSMTAAFLAFKALVEGARVEGGTLLIITAAHILFTIAVRLLMGF